jgi:hypothetical protein
MRSNIEILRAKILTSVHLGKIITSSRWPRNFEGEITSKIKFPSESSQANKFFRGQGAAVASVAGAKF